VKSRVKEFLAMLTAVFLPLMPLHSQTIFSECTEQSLRATVEGGGNILIQCTNLITLTEPLVINRNTTLFATNNKVVLTGALKTRLFVVSPGVTLTISNISLFSGRHTATNFNDGGIPDTAGAAIYNNGGTVNLHSVLLQDHTVLGAPGSAGGDNNTGGDGEAGGDAAGGAIYNKAGLVLLSKCTLTGNRVTGGIAGRGGNALRGAAGNGGNGGRGGSGGGAAVYSQGGTLLIYDTTFTNNIATGSQGGAAGAPVGFGFPGQIGEAGDGVGGAVATDAAYVVASGCSFSDNTAKAADGLTGVAGVRNIEGKDGGRGGNASGGAFYNRGLLLMTNCTLFSNSSLGGKGGNGGNGSNDGLGTDAGNGGNGGNAAGGAIENTYKTTLINCTISSNEAIPGVPGTGGTAGGAFGDSGDSGAPGETWGGGIYNGGDEVSLANTIISASTGGNFFGHFTDLGGNISSDATALFIATGSHFNLNPLLSALASNGGPTYTLAITTNSPAYNSGLAFYCPPKDQRGSNRVGVCDIGAFEVQLPSSTSTNAGTNTISTNALPLSISAKTNSFLLRWPYNTNYVLQFSSDLTSNSWQRVTLTPTALRAYNNLTVTNNATNRFFRVVPGTNSSTSTNDIPLPP
jgi:hypothetical protein